MLNPRFFRACAALAAAIAMPLAVAANATTAAPGSPQAAAPEALTPVAQSGTLGPFATMRRALEVADQYRSRGFNANAYPDGGAYWVRVWR